MPEESYVGVPKSEDQRLFSDFTMQLDRLAPIRGRDLVEVSARLSLQQSPQFSGINIRRIESTRRRSKGVPPQYDLAIALEKRNPPDLSTFLYFHPNSRSSYDYAIRTLPTRQLQDAYRTSRHPLWTWLNMSEWKSRIGYHRQRIFGLTSKIQEKKHTNIRIITSILQKLKPGDMGQGVADEHFDALTLSGEFKTTADPLIKDIFSFASNREITGVGAFVPFDTATTGGTVGFFPGEGLTLLKLLSGAYRAILLDKGDQSKTDDVVGYRKYTWMGEEGPVIKERGIASRNELPTILSRTTSAGEEHDPFTVEDSADLSDALRRTLGQLRSSKP